ncbi:hypothetical protein [Tissierella sp. P1]|nr:hypothetical protein [Tissierella sp. P1]
MTKFEQEVKVLNINIYEIGNKLEKLGAIFKGKKKQKNICL